MRGQGRLLADFCIIFGDITGLMEKFASGVSPQPISAQGLTQGLTQGL